MTTAKKKTRSKNKKVWHITDFRELFELPDDLRKKRTGPLSYTKSFVSLTGRSEACEIEHCERLAELKSRPERHLLRSVFEDLKNFSGKKSLAHRGYLVTTSSQPAGYEYLASQLKVKVEDLKQAVPVLEQIGLIERISLNGFTEEAGPKKAKNKARKKVKSGKSGKFRTIPDRSGKRRKTLKKRKRKGNQLNDKTNSNEHKANKKNGSDKSNGEENCRQRDGDNADNNEATSMPAESRGSAKGGGVRLIEFPAPSRAVNRGPETIGEIVQGVRHRYDSDCKAFGGEVYEVLGLTFNPLTVRGRRELGCFANIWERARGAGLKPEILAELRRRAIVEATKLARRKQRCRNVSAVFCHVFNRLLAAAAAAGGVAARTDRGAG